jgi:hypothetical protein
VNAAAVGDILPWARGTFWCESVPAERSIFQTKELRHGKENEGDKKETEEEVTSSFSIVKTSQL